jgi:hypothetical protein
MCNWTHPGNLLPYYCRYVSAEDVQAALQGKARARLGLDVELPPLAARRYNLPLLLQRLRTTLAAAERGTGGSGSVIDFDGFVRVVLEVCSPSTARPFRVAARSLALPTPSPS